MGERWIKKTDQRGHWAKEQSWIMLLLGKLNFIYQTKTLTYDLECKNSFIYSKKIYLFLIC